MSGRKLPRWKFLPRALVILATAIGKFLRSPLVDFSTRIGSFYQQGLQ